MFGIIKPGPHRFIKIKRGGIESCLNSFNFLSNQNQFHNSGNRIINNKYIKKPFYRPLWEGSVFSSVFLRHIGSITPTTIGGSKDERRYFMAVFPDIVRDLTETYRRTEIPDVTKWYSKVLQYNVPGGKKSRGLALSLAYRMLATPKDITPDKIRETQIMGWCIEMLHAYFVILDDIIDESETRRGRLCWYRNPDVGLIAINDGILINSGVYQLLRKYFSNHPYYIQVVDLFHEVTHKTIMGQALDILTAQSMDRFTMDRYNSIVKFKTSYYSFCLPVALALHMAGISNTEIHRQAKTLLLEMGNFYQVQDDFIDCYGNPEVSGKIGTDIQDGKCSWLAVVALQRCTPDQRKVLEKCYGSKDPEQIEAVKKIYNQINLPHIFTTYEEDSYNLINTHIQQLSAGLNHSLFFKLLNIIYKRES